MISLESLTGDKFKPLSNSQQLQVRGGGGTAGGRKIIGADRTRDGNGTAMIRYHWQTWDSDDIIGGQECFYKLSDYWSDWEVY